MGTYNATVQAVLLSSEDADSVQMLTADEIEIPESEVLTKLLLLDTAVRSNSRSHGPNPSNWEEIVSHTSDQQAFTYAFKFGKTQAWKIGRAIDLKARLSAVNKHIPFEVVGHSWEFVFQQKWENMQQAHDMEQKVLDLLEPYSIGGEMVRCSEAQVLQAWMKAIGG